MAGRHRWDMVSQHGRGWCFLKPIPRCGRQESWLWTWGLLRRTRPHHHPRHQQQHQNHHHHHLNHNKAGDHSVIFSVYVLRRSTQATRRCDFSSLDEHRQLVWFVSTPVAVGASFGSCRWICLVWFFSNIDGQLQKKWQWSIKTGLNLATYCPLDFFGCTPGESYMTLTWESLKMGDELFY